MKKLKHKDVVLNIDNECLILRQKNKHISNERGVE